MALTNITTFDLEAAPGGSAPVINASQGDIGRQFQANLYWNGETWTPGSGVTCKLRGHKPDNTVFEYTATISGSTVTFSTTEQMTIIDGAVDCELVFTQNSNVIASANFVLQVEESPYDPNNLSESDVEGLTDVLAGFQRLNRDTNGVVKIGDGVTASGTNEPIKGFYVHDEVTDIDGIARYSYEGLESNIPNPDLFGVGNIDISANGWSYTVDNEQMRVRTLPNVTIPLSAGDKIYLTDYTNARFYVGFRTGTSYSYQGWITSGAYTARANGEAVILIAYKTDPSPIVNIKENLLPLLSISSSTDGNVSLKDVENSVYKIETELKALDFSIFEIGNLYFGGTTSPFDNWSWEYNTKRVCTKKNHPIHLNAGDHVYATDTSKIEFFIGCVKDSDNTAWNRGYWSTHLAAPYSGDYYFIVRFKPETTVTNSYDVLKYFRISTSDASAYVDVNVAIGKALDESNLVSKNKLGKSFIATFGGYQSGGATPYGVPYIDTVQRKMIVPSDYLLLFDGNHKGASCYYSTGNNKVEIDYGTLGTSAIAIYFDKSNLQFVPKRYEDVQNDDEYLFATIRTSSAQHPFSVCMSSPYTIDGKLYGIDAITGDNVEPVSWMVGENVKGVNHRGFNTAPENTLPAYKLSKKKGFKYCECDVSMTSDRVPVLLHDDTINRTARNADGTEISETISIGSITYEDALEYDFGIYKSSDYAGTKIPKFEDFIILCRNLGLHPYIELKTAGGYTEAEIQNLVDIVHACGMGGKVSWISFGAGLLTYVKDYDSSARLGFVVGAITSANIETAVALKTADNEVFLDCSSLPSDLKDDCISAGIPVEVWTVNSASTIEGLDPYVSGVTSDNLIASKVLYDANKD